MTSVVAVVERFFSTSPRLDASSFGVPVKPVGVRLEDGIRQTWRTGPTNCPYIRLIPPSTKGDGQSPSLSVDHFGSSYVLSLF